MRSRRVADEMQPRRIAAVLRDVLLHPTDGVGAVLELREDVHGGHESVVQTDEDESASGEVSRLESDRPICPPCASRRRGCRS